MDRNLQTEKTTTDKPSVGEETKAASSQSPIPEKQIFKRKKMAAKKGLRTKNVWAESEKEEEEKEKEEEVEAEKEEAEEHQQEEGSA